MSAPIFPPAWSEVVPSPRHQLISPAGEEMHVWVKPVPIGPERIDTTSNEIRTALRKFVALNMRITRFKNLRVCRPYFFWNIRDQEQHAEGPARASRP